MASETCAKCGHQHRGGRPNGGTICDVQIRHAGADADQDAYCKCPARIIPHGKAGDRIPRNGAPLDQDKPTLQSWKLKCPACGLTAEPSRLAVEPGWWWCDHCARHFDSPKPPG